MSFLRKSLNVVMAVSVMVLSINTLPVMADPVPAITITGLTGATLSYRIGSGAKVIDPVAVSITDGIITDLSGGVLTVTITDPDVNPNDVLGILDTGSHISVSGNAINYDSVQFATIHSGGTGAPLVIYLNAGATPDNVAVLLNNISYTNSSFASVALRTVNFFLSDDNGNQTDNTYNATITLTRPGFHQLWG